MIEHQPACDGQPRVEERRIDPALEPLPRIAGQRQLLAGSCDMVGIEIGAFDQHVGGAFGNARLLAAHDAADIVDMGVVGDHRHALVKRIGLAVEREHALARLGAPRDQRTRQLGAIIDVQRPAEIDHHEIGDVDQRGDRLLANRGQPPRHPVGRGAVGDARHRLRVERRAARGVVGAHVGPRPFARDFHNGGLAIHLGQRLERAQPRRREIARDAAHAHAILPIGGDRHVDHRIVEARIIGVGRANRRVLGQFDDPVMPLADLQLARRTHHAVRIDPAHRAHRQRHVEPRHIGPRRPEHADQPGPRIGRAAHHLQRPLAGIDRQHLQLVRIGMRRRAQHLRHREGLKLLARIVDALDLEADARQRLDDFVE